MNKEIEPITPINAKMIVVNAIVMSVLMYGCEMWSLTKRQQLKVQATNFYRIEDMNRLDPVRNAGMLRKD